MRLRRQPPDPLIEVVRRAAEEGKTRIYRQGMGDGIELALRLLLGETGEHVGNGKPAPQPLNPELERWARDALARLTERVA